MAYTALPIVMGARLLGGQGGLFMRGIGAFSFWRLSAQFSRRKR